LCSLFKVFYLVQLLDRAILPITVVAILSQPLQLQNEPDSCNSHSCVPI